MESMACRTSLPGRHRGVLVPARVEAVAASHAAKGRLSLCVEFALTIVSRSVFGFIALTNYRQRALYNKSGFKFAVPAMHSWRVVL